MRTSLFLLLSLSLTLATSAWSTTEFADVDTSGEKPKAFSVLAPAHSSGTNEWSNKGFDQKIILHWNQEKKVTKVDLINWIDGRDYSVIPRYSADKTVIELYFSSELTPIYLRVYEGKEGRELSYGPHAAFPRGDLRTLKAAGSQISKPESKSESATKEQPRTKPKTETKPQTKSPAKTSGSVKSKTTKPASQKQKK